MNETENQMRLRMKKKPTRGGAREGAGRKTGSGAGRTVTTSSITLLPELWARLDALRADATRSAWIAAKIRNAKTQNLERQNSGAIAAPMLIEDRYIDGSDAYEDWKFMGDTARNFLEANVEVKPAAQITETNWRLIAVASTDLLAYLNHENTNDIDPR